MDKPRNLLIASLTFLICAILLGVVAKGAGPLPGDLAISRAVQKVLPFNNGVGALWSAVRDLLIYLPIGFGAVTLIWRKWDWTAMIALVCLPVSLYGERFLKPLYGRPRPTADLVTIHRASEGLSFPSGTAMNSLVQVGVILYLVWLARKANSSNFAIRLLVVLLLVIFLLSNIARIHVGAHWATDIIGGWLFGGAWLTLLMAAHQWWINRRSVGR